jgi:hypothetical protein
LAFLEPLIYLLPEGEKEIWETEAKICVINCSDLLKMKKEIMMMWNLICSLNTNSTAPSPSGREMDGGTYVFS